MSASLVVREPAQSLQTVLTNEQLQFIANTEFVPQGLRGNLPAILACVATGRALGLPDMTALRSIHIIDGKATFSAELMVQLVRRHGHSITGDVTGDSATVVGTRADNGDSMTVTWTLEMADRAGLSGKSNWKKYPESMLWARAASQLCRMLFADCFAGATYTPEELEDSEREPQAAAATSLPGDSESSASAGTQPSRSEKPITEAQKKKANLLVGTLREAGRLKDEEVYLAAGRLVPDLAEGETRVRWSPLRDSLRRGEAIVLIDRLEAYAASDDEQPPLEWRYIEATVSANPSDTVVHVAWPGNEGKRLGDLSRTDLQWLAETWEPSGSVEDERLKNDAVAIWIGG